LLAALKPSFIMVVAIVLFFIAIAALSFNELPENRKSGTTAYVVSVCALLAALGGLAPSFELVRSFVYKENTTPGAVRSCGVAIVCMSAALAALFLWQA